MAYRKLLFHTPWILRCSTRNPSFLMPTFSRTRADPGFSGRHVAQIRWSPSSPNPKSSRSLAASVAIPLPQDSGSTRYQISPSSAPLRMTTPQRPTRSPRGPSVMALTMDLQASDGDSSSESRRNFSLSLARAQGQQHVAHHIHSRSQSVDAIEIVPLQTAQRDHWRLFHDEYRRNGTLDRKITR